MSNKLLVSFWGLTINADGLWAIAAAVVIVIIIAWRSRRLLL